jgi:O-succinylhomoserine sulfhydrylase
MKHGGAMVTFELKGGLERGRRFVNSLKMVSHSSNLGDTRTIAVHPSSTTHSKYSVEDQAKVGVFPGLVRFSVGLEHANDIIGDVKQAIEVSK